MSSEHSRITYITALCSTDVNVDKHVARLLVKGSRAEITSLAKCTEREYGRRHAVASSEPDDIEPPPVGCAVVPRLNGTAYIAAV